MMQEINTEDMVKDMDVHVIRKTLKDTFQDIRQLATEAKMSFIRQDAVNELVDSNSSSNFYMVIVESVFFIAICGAQVYYIQNLLENKRLI